jgi:tRNA-2-methylthio-N6-dimethylallyladenosine synthase
VRDLAEHKASSYIGRLRDWKADRPESIIIVTGCAAERAKKELKRKFPYINLIVGAKDIETFPAQLAALLKSHQTSEENLVPVDLGRNGIDGDDLDLDHGRPSNVIQYVTIMRGCNYNCTYCIVPAVRGREIYRPVDEIKKEVSNRLQEGGKEIWLLGQTVNSYRPPNPPFPGYDFADLLREIGKEDGIKRLRFMSPHPYFVTSKLVAAMAETPTVCEQLHLPVQSGSNKMLSAMKRNYTRESYLNAVSLLREKIPGISITTDFIVGFPGETEADYELTKTLAVEAQFDAAYCFKYSPRPGTPAHAMKDDVPTEIKESRVTNLLDTLERQGIARVKSFVGTTQEVLIEDNKGGGLFRGKTRHGYRVRLTDATLKLGDLVQVKVTGHHSRELHGERLNTSPSQKHLVS